MKSIIPLVLAGILALPAAAQPVATEPAPAPELTVLQGSDVSDLNQFLWLKRVVAVFADSPADPRYIKQIELLDKRPEDLALRDVVVVLDADPSAESPLRAKLRPRGFMLALLAKDGSVVLRKPSPWDIREISRSIDKLPLRQQEINERRGLRPVPPPAEPPAATVTQ